jgi:CelD/BcsL family acetyltransferase involved in cellulose biosynthesis
MHIAIIKEVEDLFKIKEDWEALCDALGDSVSVFSSFEWYATWWRNYSAGASLNMIAMWEADRLVGIAPLMRQKATIHGLPATILCFMENSQSLHNDFIVLPTSRKSFLREAMRLLYEQIASKRCDAIVFNNFPETSVNYRTLMEILDVSCRTWRQNPTWFNSPYLVPSGTWEDYLAGRSPRTRKRLRNIRNNMIKAGEVSFKNIRTWDELQQVKEEVFSVAKRSWAESTGDSLATPANAEFFRDLADCMAKKGWLSLWVLYLNGKMIAVEFHLNAYGKEHAMRGHYLPEYAALSPGTFLELEILKNVFETADRVQLYDFGGSFENYKKKWTDDSVQQRAVWVFNDSIYSRFIAFHEIVTVPLLRRVFPQKLWQSRAFKICGINPNRFEPRKKI